MALFSCCQSVKAGRGLDEVVSSIVAVHGSSLSQLTHVTVCVSHAVGDDAVWGNAGAEGFAVDGVGCCHIDGIIKILHSDAGDRTMEDAVFIGLQRQPYAYQRCAGQSEGLDHRAVQGSAYGSAARHLQMCTWCMPCRLVGDSAVPCWLYTSSQ